MLRGVLSGIAIGLVALLSLAACSTTATPAAPSSVMSVTIGFPDDFTGGNSYAGASQQRAARLAVTDVNSSNQKLNLKLVEKDTKSTQPDGVAAFQSLVADPSVDAIVGIAFTQTGQAGLPILGPDGRPTIYLQVTSMPNRPSNVFSMAAPRVPLATMMIDKVIATKGVKSIGLIFQDQPTLSADATAWRDAAKKNNINVVADQGATLETTDFSTQVTSVMAANPDAVGIAALTPQSGTIASQLRSRGFKGIIFAQQSVNSEDFRKVAGAAAEGTYVFTFWDVSAANAEAKRFVDLYKKAYPDSPAPDIFPLQAWDAIHIMAQAIEKAGSKDKAKVVAQLASGSFAAGAQDTIKFGPDGFAQLSGYVIQMVGPGTQKVAP